MNQTKSKANMISIVDMNNLVLGDKVDSAQSETQ